MEIRICKALKQIAEDDINRLIIYPVHLNPKVQDKHEKSYTQFQDLQVENKTHRDAPTIH